jgi:hypothetical protein
MFVEINNVTVEDQLELHFKQQMIFTSGPTGVATLQAKMGGKRKTLMT